MLKLQSFPILVIILVFMNLSCTVNILEDTADVNTAEAKFFQAQREINGRNFSQAILLLESLSPDFLALEARRAVLPSAYAGRCGLEFLTLLTSLQNTSSSAILSLLMESFPGATEDNVEDCLESIRLLQAIGDESVRTGDENLLTAFVSLAKIGTILASLADMDEDGQADASFNQCDTTDLPEQMVREVGAGLGLAILSLGAVGASYIDGALNSFTTLCGQDPNLAAFCTVSNPATFTSAQVQAFRYAIGSNNYGINSCGNRDFSACALANPVCN